jgi:type IV pilus assembly protein PilB
MANIPPQNPNQNQAPPDFVGAVGANPLHGTKAGSQSGVKTLADLLSGKPHVEVTTHEKEEQFEQKMEEIDIKEKETATEREAARLHYPYINLEGFPIGPETLSLIPRERSKNSKVICFLHSGSEIRLATVDPTKQVVLQIVNALKERYNAHVVLYLVSEHSFEKAYKLYDTIMEVKRNKTGIEVTGEEMERFREDIKTVADIDHAIKKANTTEMLSLLMAGALNSYASDVHIEAEEKDIKVRYRIDGVLHDITTIQSKRWSQLSARIKLLAGLKINIEDKPQDGRFGVRMGESEVDVRVSTIPTNYGESIVIRLLGNEETNYTIRKLGLKDYTAKPLAREIRKPNGMIITTGPTGSGKTTTLYAILQQLNNEETKIITLEDPIEYKIAGINQSQIDHTRDYTYASGLKSILRQDPDIIMVGEIRDFETADTAINASMTGHLVLSTLHTNSAAGAVPRFLAMGVKPFLLAPSLNAIIAQRLARRLCTECKILDVPDKDVLERIRRQLAKLPDHMQGDFDMNNLQFFKPRGDECAACGGIGYRGRIGLYEILTMTEKVEQLILSGNVSEYKMQEVAVADGMVTMTQDALLKALDGLTSLAEIMKVVDV